MLSSIYDSIRAINRVSGVLVWVKISSTHYQGAVLFDKLVVCLCFLSTNNQPKMPSMYIAGFRIHLIKIEFTFYEPKDETPDVSATCVT